jgi:hypothetical protein
MDQLRIEDRATRVSFYDGSASDEFSLYEKNPSSCLKKNRRATETRCDQVMRLAHTLPSDLAGRTEYTSFTVFDMLAASLNYVCFAQHLFCHPPP